MPPTSLALGFSSSEPASPARTWLRSVTALAIAAAAIAAPSLARADEPTGWADAPDASAPAQPPPAPAPRPRLVVPSGPLPPNIVTYPDGSVTVTRTPEGGVDVHAQTASGTVHAYGCSRVDLDARTATGAPPPPCPVTAYPYPFPYVYPYPVMPYPAYLPPPRLPPPRPKYAPDPGRTGALIGASLVFGIGTAATGTAYAFSVAKSGETACDTWGAGGCSTRRSEPSKAALYAMGGIMTVTPSIPRYVVGDVGLGLLFTALRGGSFAAGAFIDWKDDKSYVLPITFAFVVPLALGIVDLATTPHRETVDGSGKPAPAAAQKKPLHVELAGLGPSAIPDGRGNLAPSVSAMGRF
jgi:hypothetical protein